MTLARIGQTTGMKGISMKLRSRLAVTVAALLAASSATVASASSASALNNVWGCVWNQSVCHYLTGEGNNITKQTGTFGTKQCNWRIDFVYYTTSGAEWYRDRGPVHSGCVTSGSRARGTGWAPNGKACAAVYYNTSVYYDKACVNIQG